ncbi:MAG: pilus assembly protein PilM [Candidatus Zixiibacteriota bacterium]
MLKLNSIINRIKKEKPDKGSVDKNTGPSKITVKKIHPAKHQFFGKIISFNIDNFSIEMAATWHWGYKRKLLAIKIDYFPKENFSSKKKKQFISNKISEFINRYGGMFTKISLPISGKETTFRTITMPALNKKDLTSAIGYEVNKQIPFPIEDCNYNFRTVYEITDTKKTLYKIDLQAATKKYIFKRLEPFESQGINISSLYHTNDATGQLLKHLKNYNEHNNYTLLRIGLEETEISFYNGSTLEFSHIFTVSSVILGDKPERTRYEYFAELIANEIQTSLDFYTGQYTSSFNNKIYVYGDHATKTELLDLLNSTGGIKFELFPVAELNFINIIDVKSLDVLVTCLPVLAISTCQVSLANLLPAGDRLARRLARINAYSKYSLALLAFILMVSWGVLRNDINEVRENLMSTNHQIEEFKNSEFFHTYNLIKRQIAYDQSYMDLIKGSPSYLNLNLKELSNLTPLAIELIFLKYQSDLNDGNIYMHGVVESKDIPPEIILAEYIENLIASPFYEDVAIIRHVKKKVRNHFEIEFQIKMQGTV